jgi:ubiquinone/menaquinone biosynthesis C-methylase UbiE
MKLTVMSTPRVTQCQRPTGLMGRFVLWNMNSRHSKVTDWGLARVVVEKHHTILDVGCGGGRAVRKLAAMATVGKVYGVDHSPASVAFATKTNKKAVAAGQVSIIEGSVSRLPFPDRTFDLITAIETHFWWPDLAGDMRELLRMLKPGGTLLVIAEVYRGANTTTARLVEKYLPATGMKFLTADEHQELFAHAGYDDIHVTVDPRKGWIAVTGVKPA